MKWQNKFNVNLSLQLDDILIPVLHNIFTGNYFSILSHVGGIIDEKLSNEL